MRQNLRFMAKIHLLQRLCTGLLRFAASGYNTYGNHVIMEIPSRHCLLILFIRRNSKVRKNSGLIVSTSFTLIYRTSV